MTDKQLKKFAIDHVNSDHLDALINIYKTYVNKPFKKILLLDFDLNYIYLKIDAKKEKIPYEKSLKSLNEFKDAFILMSQKFKDGFDLKKVEKALKNLMNEYNSIVLSTIVNNTPVISTAPIMQYKNKFYIYISQIAEHYSAIKQNPDKIRFMYIEDEKIAASPINRKRVVYTAKARFVTNKKEFNEVFDSYIKKIGKGSGVETIRTMEDFHLIELQIQSGRLILGFGQAYLLKNGKIISLNVTNASGHKQKH